MFGGLARRVLRGVGVAVKSAGPLAAGFATGGPLGAGLAVAAQFAGATEKRRGKRAEATERRPPVHKATAPAAALATPVALSVALAALGFELPAGSVDALCGGGPAGAGLVAGLAALLSHQLGHGLHQASVRRR